MANNIIIEYPRENDVIPVQLSGGNYFLPYMSGTACVDTGTLSSITARTCDHGNTASCATPTAADVQLRGQFGATKIYFWSASNVLIRNVTNINTGAVNDAVANLVTAGPAGNKDSNAVQFTALKVGVFFQYLALASWRRVYRLRFDTSTLPAYFNRLANLGMPVSKRVKLIWQADNTWTSSGDKWTLTVNGATASISAMIPIVDTFEIQQVWSCSDFHARRGGVFAPQAIPVGDGTFQPPIVPLNLLVR